MLRYCTFSWTSTHTSCYTIVRSLGLPRIRHAILLYQYVLLDFHTYVMLRYCTFSWTSTRTSCYSTVPVRSLGLPHIHHATLLHVLLDFHPYVMLRYCKSLKDFLSAHMVLKCKERGHSTLHPSVTQYVFMWCWRSSLQNPDLKRFLEELPALL